MGNTRASQAGYEALVSVTNDARVTQVGYEALVSESNPSKPHITQVGYEALFSASGNARASQVGYEALVSFLAAPLVTLFGLCSREIEVDAVAIDALMFNFYRSTSEFGTYTLRATQGSGTYLDTVPIQDTPYWYKVSAVYVAGLGPLSTPLSAQAFDVLGQMTPPKSVAGDWQVTLTWAPFAGATGYALFRDGTEIATGITALFYIDTNVTDDTQYSYQLSAINNCGNGPLSTAVTAIPRCCQGEYTGDMVSCDGYTADTVNCGGYSSAAPITNSWGRQTCP